MSLGTYAQHERFIDSTFNLVENEPNDSIKYFLIKDALTHQGITDIRILDNYYEKAIKIFSELDDKHYLLRTYDDIANYMLFIGALERSLKGFNTLKSTAIQFKKPRFIAMAHLGMAKFYLQKGEKEKAKNILNLIIEDRNSLVHTNNVSQAYIRLSTISRNEGDYRKSLSFLNSALENINTSINVSIGFSIYNSQGRIYRFMGINDSAKISYLKAENIADILNNDQARLTILNNLGNIEHINGNYDSAISYYLRSLELKEKFANKRGISISLHNIGAIKYDMKSYEDAIIDFEKSKAIGNEINFIPIVIYNDQKIGNCYRELSNMDKALEHHIVALKNARETNFNNGIIEALQNIGHDNIILKKYDEADNYLIEGLKMAKKAGSKPFESSILVHIANSYLEKQKSKINDLIDNPKIDNNIESYLLRAKELADEMKNVDNQNLALQGLNLYYTSTEQHKENAATLSALLILKDSLFLKERTQAITDWETKYETVEKEKEISNLEIEQQKAKARIKFWSITSFLLLSIIGIGTYLYLQLKKTRLKLQSQNQKLKELNQTKDRFFGIIAHDIRSPIVALESVDEQMDYYLEKNKIDKLTNLGSLIGKTARHLNNLLDNLLNWALLKTNSIPFNTEIVNISEIISDVSEIMKVNLEIKNITLVSNIPSETLVKADHSAISTILRNLISNAIKYSQENDKITLDYQTKLDKHYFEIKDEGLGINEETISTLFELNKKSRKGTLGEKGTGLGLILCKELVEMHKGEIFVKSKVNIGTSVTFYIPKSITSD